MSEVDRLTGLVGYSGAKIPVRSASTGVLVLTGEQTVDGVALVTGDRCLVKNQGSSVDNGIYVVDSGAWERAQDCDGPYDLRMGSVVFVTDGVTTFGFWYCTSANPVVIETDNITFAQASTVLATLTAFAQTLVAAVSAAAARTVLGIDTLYNALVPFGANGTIPIARSTSTNGLSYVAALSKAIYGWTYANNVTDAANDLDIAAGGGMSSGGTNWITGAALTKRSDAVWAVGNNQGMLDTGVVGNNDYYLYAINRPDTDVTDYICSLAAPSVGPALPANYTVFRAIGWFKRAGGTIVAFNVYEIAGGGIELAWRAPTLDVNLSNTLTTARRTDAVKVPLGFSVLAKLGVAMNDAASAYAAYVFCPDVTDAAPSGSPETSNFQSLLTTQVLQAQLEIRTSAAGLIAARASIATVDTYTVSTYSFKWSRR